MADYKLTYFDLQGRAETSRLLLVYGGVQWEDERIEFDKWPAMKESELACSSCGCGNVMMMKMMTNLTQALLSERCPC